VGELAQVLLFVGEGEVNHRGSSFFVGALDFEGRAWSAPTRRGVPPIDWSVNQCKG
jgi:hypothetical protein